APRARRWSGPPVGGLHRDRPVAPSSRSLGQSVRTRATAPPVFAQIGPDQPSVAGTPAHRAGDSSASLALLLKWKGVHRTGSTPSLDDFSAGIRALDRLTQPRPVKGRNLKGLNFFSRAEQTLLPPLQRPGFNIAGLRRADLLPLLGQSSPATLSRQLARLRHLGVIKRVLGTYRYYLTRAGRAAIAAGRRLTEHTIIPALA